MIRAGWARCCAAGFFLSLLLCGCMPVSESQLDEQKEPNFIAGKNLLSQMDYEGAVEAFERAIEVNPHSASAHYELGCLYDEKLKKPADAIYHYNRYLRFSNAPGDSVKGRKPGAKDEIVQQRINSCTLDLARGVSFIGGPVTSAAQREIDRLTQENKSLGAKIDTLQQQLATAQAALADNARVKSMPAPPPALDPNSSGQSQHVSPRSDPLAPVALPGRVTPLPDSGSTHYPSHPAGGGKTSGYVIRPGDTIAAIARRQGIPLESLLAANPQLSPRHLIPGKTISIPAR